MWTERTLSDWKETVRRMIHLELNKLSTVSVGVVDKVGEDGTVDVRPLLYSKRRDGVAPKIVKNVSVLYLRTAEAGLFYPLAPGAEGLLLSCSRSITAYLRGDKTQEGEENALMEMGDSFFLPCLKTGKSQEKNLLLKHRQSELSFDGALVRLKGESSSLRAELDKIYDLLKQLRDEMEQNMGAFIMASCTSPTGNLVSTGKSIPLAPGFDAQHQQDQKALDHFTKT